MQEYQPLFSWLWGFFVSEPYWVVSEILDQEMFSTLKRAHTPNSFLAGIYFLVIFFT